jgi:hypothetical protein
MKDLTPQERFNQLLSFLKNPDKHIFKRTGDIRLLPIWSISFPTLSLEDAIFLPGRKHSAGLVHEFRKEAIEVMGSNMFRNGLLRGNQKTPAIAIDHSEEFVLPIAAVIHIAKNYIAKSLLEVRSHTFDGKPRVFDELRTAWDDLLRVFDQAAKITLDNGLIRRPDKLVGLIPRRRPIVEAQINRLVNEEKYEEIDSIIKKIPGGIRGKLVKMRADILYKAHLKETKEMENTGFDVIDELMHIFLKYVAEAPDNLIASHIFEFISVRQDSSLRGIYLPGSPDALRKRIEKQRRLAATTEIQ